MATTINPRVILNDDSGTPANPVGDGTTVNNALFQLLQDAIDNLFSGTLVLGGNLTLEGGNLSVVGTLAATGQATFSGPAPSIVSTANIRAGSNPVGDVLVLLGRADGLANILFKTSDNVATTGAIQVNPALGQMALRVGGTPTTALVLTAVAITPLVPVTNLQVGDIGAATAGKIGISGNALVFLGGSAGHAFLNSVGGVVATLDAAGVWTPITTPSVTVTNLGGAAAGKIGLATNALSFVGGSSGFTFLNSVGGVVATLDAAGVLALVGRINSAAAQPGFLALSVVPQAGITGVTTVVFGSEIYDQAGNFAANTFTAPVTGTYAFAVAVQLFLSSGPGNAGTRLVTSNRTYTIGVTGTAATGASIFTHTTVLADMDAGDTAVVQVSPSSGTWQVDAGSAGNLVSYISGRLVV